MEARRDAPTVIEWKPVGASLRRLGDLLDSMRRWGAGHALNRPHQVVILRALAQHQVLPLDKISEAKHRLHIAYAPVVDINTAGFDQSPGGALGGSVTCRYHSVYQ